MDEQYIYMQNVKKHELHFQQLKMKKFAYRQSKLKYILKPKEEKKIQTPP